MTTTIDPRIRERRIEVKREAGRKRLRVLLGAIVAFVAVGTVYLAVESPLLDVDHVRITGVQHLDAATVASAASVRPGAPLLRVDTGAVAARVERLPWVASATVSRALPGTLRITVTERVPVAWVRRDDAHVALLAVDGTVIADTDAPPAGLVEVRGTPRVPAPGARLTPARGGRGGRDATGARDARRRGRPDRGRHDTRARRRRAGAVVHADRPHRQRRGRGRGAAATRRPPVQLHRRVRAPIAGVEVTPRVFASTRALRYSLDAYHRVTLWSTFS